MKNIFLLLVLSLNIAAAQQGEIPRDTSFTVYSAYAKESKKYPFIKIAAPEMPGGVARKSNIVFSKIGKRELTLDIFYPSKKSKVTYPGVLLIFGGGWRSGEKSQSVPMAQQLAAKGYVAVAVEYRLSLEAKYPAAVYDLKAAARWMRANASAYNLDKTKIAILGVSAGGQLAALVGTTNGIEKFEGTGGNPKQSSSVQAIVDIDGVLAFKHPESEEGAVAAFWLGGTYEQRPEIWEEASALSHAGKNTPPVLFLNSSNPRFHAGRDDMIKKLDASHIYSEVHTIADTPHPFWLFHPWFEQTVDFTIGFLDKVFKNRKTFK